jgi:predicted secreted protein
VNWVTGVVLYVLLWWVLLFAVLPFGARPIDDAAEVAGGWRGAPEHPHLWRAVLITTLLAAAAWAACYAVIVSPWLSFRSGWLALPGD